MIPGLTLITGVALGLAGMAGDAARADRICEPLEYAGSAVTEWAEPWWDGGAKHADDGVMIDGARWRMAWDESTRKQVSREDFGGASYARMIELRSGALLCIYEADGSVFAVTSDDGGASWGKSYSVAWAQRGIAMTAPEVLELADGSLLACYNARPFGKVGGPRNFGIRTRKSFDGGKTWKRGRLIHEAGSRFTDGCWEPAAVQMPDGELRLFFADEGPYRRTDEQNISMLRSNDGGLNWSEKPQVVSFYKGARDGMPVPLVLPGKDAAGTSQVVCAIEMFSMSNELQPALLRDVGARKSPVIDRWDERREWPFDFTLGAKVYGGAPYVRALGTTATVMSYQGSEGRKRGLYHCDMKVVVGDGDARKFGGRTAPFKVPRDRCALWNSLCVTRSGDVIAITSTNAYANRAQIWMIRGRLTRE